MHSAALEESEHAVISIPKRQLATLGESVKLANIADSTHFFVQSMGGADEYFSLRADLKTAAETAVAVDVSTLTVGQYLLGCARGHTWYRVEVTEILSINHVRVLFVDEGEYDVLSGEALRRLPVHLARVPRLSILCSLHGGEAADLSHLQRRLPALVQATPVPGNGSSATSCQSVTLLLDGKNVCELVDKRAAPFIEALATGKKVEVMLSFCKSLDDVWLQQVCRRDSFNRVFCELQNFMQTSSSLSILPSVGDIVSAIFEDGYLYRARVVEIIEDACLLHFIDYGNFELTQLCKIHALPVELLEEEPFAWQAALDGNWSANGNAENIGKQVMDVASSLILEVLDLKKNKSPPRVQLKLDSGELLTDYLIQRGIISAKHAQSENSSSVAADTRNCLPPTEPFPTQLKVHFMTVQTMPSLFVMPESSSRTLQTINATMKEEHEATIGQPEKIVKNALVGQVFAARSTKYSGHWYRAQVVSNNTASGCVVVNFIDYGESEELPLNALRPLSTDLVNTVPLVTTVKLAGVGVCQPEAADWFTEKVRAIPEQLLQCEVVRHGAPMLVRLFTSDEDISKSLLKSGLAEPDLDQPDTASDKKEESLTEQNQALRAQLARYKKP